MTFNIDPVSATLMVAFIGVVLRAWDSIGKKIDTRHAEALKALTDALASNNERRAELVKLNEKAHEEIHEQLGEHGEKINGLRREVDHHGFRLTAVENKGG